MAKDGLLINGALWKEYKVINLFFVVYGGGSCVDDKARINILFTDGSRMEMYNDVDFNCDQIFSLNFLGMSGKKKQLQSLMTKNLDKVRISTSDGKSVSQIFDKSQSDKFRESIKCLYNIL
jgi:hypothetical protein